MWVFREDAEAVTRIIETVRISGKSQKHIQSIEKSLSRKIKEMIRVYFHSQCLYRWNNYLQTGEELEDWHDDRLHLRSMELSNLRKLRRRQWVCRDARVFFRVRFLYWLPAGSCRSSETTVSRMRFPSSLISRIPSRVWSLSLGWSSQRSWPIAVSAGYVINLVYSSIRDAF